MNSQKLLEADIKAKLVNHLYQKNRIYSDSVIVSELTIGGFARRVDLVTANSNELIAYEIKSASDNLSRLSGQIDDYLKYFDKVIVVADSKHIDSILKLTPRNVGVWELSNEKITTKKRGVKVRIADKSALASFLTTSEITKLIPKIYKSYDRVSRKEIMLKANSVKKLRKEVYEYLYRKFSINTHKLLRKLDSGSIISSFDIEQLSVYISERRAIEKEKTLKSKLWKEWEIELSSEA